MSDFDNDDIRRLDGGLLLVFRELLRRGRATEAAEALGLSPSAVSHALARLRDLFADPLFVRRPHGLEPTARARALGPRIEALIELAETTLKREGAFDPKASTRRFNIVAPDFVIALIGARLVQTLRNEAPNASVVMMPMAHDAAFDALKRGEADFAIGRFPAPPQGLAIEALFEDRYCVVARRAHPRFQSGRISLKAYAEAGHIYSFAPGEGGDVWDDHEGGKAKLDAVVSRWMTVLIIVAASDSIGTVPRKLAERHAEILGLQILAAPFVSNRIAVSVARRAGQADPGADWFLAQVRVAVG